MDYWREHWRATGDDAYRHDLCREVREAAAHAAEPRDVLAIAGAGVEAAQSLTTALDIDWALYTPRQAAHIASAVLAQIESSARNLEKLGHALKEAAARGDFEMPAPSGIVSRDAENLADAIARMRTTASELDVTLADHAETITTALQSTPCDLKLPSDIHETIHAVAGLLQGERDLKITLRVPHEPGDFDAERTDFGCGCGIDITQNGETYHFGRGDCHWSIVRASDGETLPDGSTVYGRWTQLEASEYNAHPAQLAEDIRATLFMERQG